MSEEKQYTTRYCAQSSFKVLVCGGRKNQSKKPVSRVNQVDVSNLNVEGLPAMKENRYKFNAVCLKGEIYVLGGRGGRCRDRDNNLITYSVEKYSPFSKTWEKVAEIPGRSYYISACAYRSEIYIFGVGKFSTRSFNSSCLQFITEGDYPLKYSFQKRAEMHDSRMSAACAVYDEKVVVSGGNCYNDALNTVESYNFTIDTQKRKQRMRKKIYGHKLILVKNFFFS